MGTKANYTLVGLFVILLSTTAIVLFLWFSAFRHHQTFDTYLVYMHEEVSGISMQTLVRFNGVKVGYVQKIEINSANPQQVILTLKIKHETPITTSTVATLRSEGIIGADYISLKALTIRALPLMVKPGEKYPVIPSKPSLIIKLSMTLQEVTKIIKELSNNISRVFDEKNQLAISTSLVNLKKFTETLADNAENIDAAFHSIKQLDRAERGIALTVDDAHIAMQNISIQILPIVQQLLTKFNTTTAYLQQLSVELQNNPSMLVRGKYPPILGPGER